MKKFGTFFVVLAGCFWGSMGVFLKSLQDFGFTARQCTALRIFSASLIFLIFALLSNPKCLKIKFKDLPMLILAGTISVGGMSMFYLSAIDLTSLSVAAVLLYTSPVWVMIFSVLFLKEKFTLKKAAAAILAFLGCVLISGFGGEKNSLLGIVIGLLSGVFYALYSIFGSFALRKNSGLTVTCYAFLFAALSLLVVGDVPGIVQTAGQAEDVSKLWITVALTGLVTAVIPFGLYTAGLKYVKASKAAVLACIEPLTASVFGLLLYNEKLNYPGILLILIAIFMLSKKEKE